MYNRINQQKLNAPIVHFGTKQTNVRQFRSNFS